MLSWEGKGVFSPYTNMGWALFWIAPWVVSSVRKCIREFLIRLVTQIIRFPLICNQINDNTTRCVWVESFQHWGYDNPARNLDDFLRSA